VCNLRWVTVFFGNFLSGVEKPPMDASMPGQCEPRSREENYHPEYLNILTHLSIYLSSSFSKSM